MVAPARRVAPALAALVLLAGCSSAASKPVSLPSLAPSHPPTASASASDASDLDGVAAVVRKYFLLINGETTVAAARELASLMTVTCKCRRVADSVREAAIAHRMYFGATRITSFVPNLDAPHQADVLVTYDASSSGLRAANGSVVSRERAAHDLSADFRLVKVAGRWLIAVVQVLSAGHGA